MLTVWCYRPLSNHISIGRVAWTWVGHSSPQRLLHHCTQQPLGSCFSYIHPLELAPNGVIGFEAISRRLGFLTFPAQVCRHSALLFQVHFVWPLMRFCSECAFVWVRAQRCLTASMAFTASDWSWMWVEKKKGEKEHLSPFHSINHDSSFSSTSLILLSFSFL